MINNKNIDGYKKKLQEELHSLNEEIERNNKPSDFGHDVDDFDEETDESEAFGDQLALVQTLKKRLADVNSALQKIESGTYGFCEKCGVQIGDSILSIDPESRFCKDCKLNV